MENTENEKRLRFVITKSLDQINNEVLTEADKINPDEETSKMTLNQYVSNPTGKGSAYVAARSQIKKGLTSEYIKLLREHRRDFYAIPYIYGNGDVLFYVKVPSNDIKNNKISYDVLFLIKYSETKSRINRNMQLYSNSPSFIFTYCYVYNKHDLLIEKLKSKLPKEALTMPPVIRNPIESLGFEKSTYIAAKYLIDGGCLTDAYVNRFGIVMTDSVEAKTFNKIADPELLVSIYQHAKWNERKTHRTEIDPSVKHSRDQQLKNYETAQKTNKPRTTSFIVSRAPRSKITARKVIKAMEKKEVKRNLTNKNNKRK